MYLSAMRFPGIPVLFHWRLSAFGRFISSFWLVPHISDHTFWLDQFIFLDLPQSSVFLGFKFATRRITIWQLYKSSFICNLSASFHLCFPLSGLWKGPHWFFVSFFVSTIWSFKLTADYFVLSNFLIQIFCRFKTQ